MKKKLLSWLLTLTLVLSVVGITPLVASAATVTITGADYAIRYDADGFYKYTGTGDTKGAAFTEGGAAFDWNDSTKTLTLTDFSFTTTQWAALRPPVDATIVLVGDNTLTCTRAGSGSCWPIYPDYPNCDLTITSSTGGSLTVAGPAVGSYPSYAIFADSGGNVTINGNADVTIIGGAGSISCGILADGSVTISGSAKVTATGGTAEGSSYGISANNNVTISGTAEVNGTGGVASGGYDSYGIQGTKVEITGGTVKANGGDTNGGASAGIQVSGGSSSIAVSGNANVTAKGSDVTDGCSYGIYGSNPNSTVTVGGNATVTADGGVPGTMSKISGGIYTDSSVTVSGGTVNATGAAATGGSSYGIRALSDVAVIGSANVTAESGAGSNSYGIRADSSVTVSGGTVTAICGGAAGLNSYGIYAGGSGLAISGGTVKATSEERAIFNNGSATGGGAGGSFGFTVPDGYNYWVATDTANTTGQQNGTSDGTFAITSAHKYAKIETPAGPPSSSATVITAIAGQTTIWGGGDGSDGAQPKTISINVAHNVTAITAANITRSTGSTVVITGGTLAVGVNTVEIEVTAEDGVTKLYYKATVTRADAAAGGGGGGGGSVNNSSVSPAKAGYDKDGGGDISVTLNSDNYTLKSLKNGSYTLKAGTDYNVNGNKVTIKASYLSGLAAGAQTITFEMSGGNSPNLTVTVTDSNAGDKPAGPSNTEPMKPYKPAGTEVDASKTNNPLILDGEQADFPAVKVDGWNWLKLRDVAMLLSGTSKQFSVIYDEAANTIIITTGDKYEPIGDELLDMLTGDFTAVASGQKLMFNGKPIEIAAYNIEGYNYFRLRDLMILLDVLVVYDEATGEITLDLSKPYSE